MKNTYNDFDDFLSNIMPIEFRKKIHKESTPERRGSNRVTNQFEERMDEIFKEENDKYVQV